jgi:hypothetical protein
MFYREEMKEISEILMCIGFDKTTMAGLFEFGEENGEVAYKLHFMVSRRSVVL